MKIGAIEAYHVFFPSTTLSTEQTKMHYRLVFSSIFSILRHMIDWKTVAKPIVALAPMADMSDLPFCLVCKEEGTPFLFREMVSSEAVVRFNPKTLKIASFDERERPLVQQIFGANPDVMAEAARIIYEKYKPDAIDINMGCPVYNLVSNFNGAALMKEPEKAAAIVRAIKKAVPCPISVKTRTGWKQDTDCLEFVKVIADAGADLISMHGRTREQGYSGSSNWERIGEARRNVPQIPFLANGDITTPELAKDALEVTGADGVLMARGMLGNPWLAKQVLHYLETGAKLPDPDIKERVRIVKKHAALQVEHYGERGLIKLRKHLPWYFKHMTGWKDLRSKLVRVNTLAEVNEILDSIS
ncbi:tRNA dihydrouridine synthase DusB [Candidatus Uhrbacteria bacterium CG22_combo_CG10-13_8_21_14_all_47_17]|uniref:tRNA-dihydrouridine synthase n=1 Tax=Candidatus Uhrbacteria bacterium CG22_combo_CG10-13_8_21_14_all_47_17 TaxID=1975041 RepID=A0A2H0BRF5_9BACT|nr:MAG: tRNA dihydrouridine synthase DusB [Candidatus Uhrbacteria bacterium CG22_combo_CG10-13_8_21_14_all_47_17]